MKKFALALSTAMVVGASASAALAANPPLPGLTNLDFSQYTGSAPKGCFTCVAPLGWTGGTGLIFIDSQASFNQSAAGPVYLTTYGNPVGSVPGNYVEADGNPLFESGFHYALTGLTVGQTYSLSFYQGASTQTTFGVDPRTGQPQATTNQWIVSLGTSGMSICGAGPVDPTYGPTEAYCNADPNASIAASPLMTVPYQGTVGWQYVSVDLTADAPDQLLSFLAWGDNGSTINLPPIAFLAGVNSPPGLGSGTPEPTSWALMITGFLGIGGIMRRQRKAVAADA